MSIAPPQAPTTGEQVELGRYRTTEEARVLLGRRIDGIVHVYDAPAVGSGRRYFVEARFDSLAELAVLIADYRRQAELNGSCPMGPHGLDHILTPPDFSNGGGIGQIDNRSPRSEDPLPKTDRDQLTAR